MHIKYHITMDILYIYVYCIYIYIGWYLLDIVVPGRPGRRGGLRGLRGRRFLHEALAALFVAPGLLQAPRLEGTEVTTKIAIE